MDIGLLRILYSLSALTFIAWAYITFSGVVFTKQVWFEFWWTCYYSIQSLNSSMLYVAHKMCVMWHMRCNHNAKSNKNCNYPLDILQWRHNECYGVSFVCSSICSGADHRKHQSPASLAFVRGIHRSPMDSPHKAPVTQKMFPFDDVIIITAVSLNKSPYRLKPGINLRG